MPSEQGHGDDDLVVACAWCDRVRLGTDWAAAEDAIRRLRTYENQDPPSFTHTICDTCVEDLERRRSTATTAARRST
jgi:glycine cleavage system aminomethyltransferase T